MLNRRPTAIAAPFVGLMLAASLSACGFHYPTDRVNVISAGINDRTGTVDALGIRILATAPGQGRVIGALANEQDSPVSLTKVSDKSGTLTASFKPVRLTGSGNVNLSEEVTNPIEVTGDFKAGQVIMNFQMTFTRNGKTETLTFDAPVVKNCYQYTAVPTPSSPATSESTAKAGKGATTGTASAPATTASASESQSTAPTVCSDDEPTPSESPEE